MHRYLLQLRANLNHRDLPNPAGHLAILLAFLPPSLLPSLAFPPLQSDPLPNGSQHLQHALAHPRWALLRLEHGKAFPFRDGIGPFGNRVGGFDTIGGCFAIGGVRKRVGWRGGEDGRMG
jgi:hypothetical protein